MKIHNILKYQLKLSMLNKKAKNFSYFFFTLSEFTKLLLQTTQETNNTPIQTYVCSIKLVDTLTPQSVTHTNYIHLPIPPWLMHGVVTF